MYGDVGGGTIQNSTHATRTRVVIKMKMFAFQNRYFDFISNKKVHAVLVPAICSVLYEDKMVSKTVVTDVA